MGAEVLTWEEIQRRYPDEWVLIANPELGEDLEVLDGVVVYHGDDVEEIDRQATERGLKNTAVLYTGCLFEKDVAYIL